MSKKVVLRGQEFLKAWVEALRSGKYRQTRSNLQRNYSGGSRAYCCLGVACRVAGVKTKSAELDHCGFLNDQFLESLEIDINQPHLVSLNDCKKYNFRQIADYIEKEYIK